MWSCGNVHVDTSGSNQWMRWMPEELTTKIPNTQIRRNSRCGTGRIRQRLELVPRGFSIRYYEDQIRDCRELGLSQDQMVAIFGGMPVGCSGWLDPGAFAFRWVALLAERILFYRCAPLSHMGVLPSMPCWRT